MRPDEELRVLMLRYLEGALPSPDLERLDRAMESDPAARRAMAELMLQETLLTRLGQESEFFELQTEQASTKRKLQTAAFRSTSRIMKIQRQPAARRNFWTTAAAAAAILFAVSLFIAVRSPRTTPPDADRTAIAAAPPEIRPEPEIRPLPGPPAPAEVRPEPAPALLPAPIRAPLPPKPKPPEVKKELRPEVASKTVPDPGLSPTPQPANVPPTPLLTDRPPIDPAGRYWETSIAKIERVQGEVFVLSGAVRKAARAGQDLLWGQGLETVGAAATVVIKYSDGTRLELAPRSVLWDSSDRPEKRGAESPKRVRVAAGVVTADVAKQASGRPMLLLSSHGEVKILGTSFKLVVEPESMRLEMKEGKIQVTRKDDQASVDVGAGFYVVVGKGFPMDVKRLPAPESTRSSGSK